LHCLNAIENSGGLTAGALAAEAGLTTGAVTGVIDRLERVGFARRVPDPDDRRRVKVEVTPNFYARADKIWAPMRADWESILTGRFTVEDLVRITEFLRATNEIARQHLDRLDEMD
jgi:DNA-binding MarR family transcriptional regulator